MSPRKSHMNAMESPEPLFWDVGSGVCDSTGVCWIALRPEYAETISRRAALRWVVTPTGGAGNLWVEKLDSGALVHGGSGQRFDWMCAGVQRGFESLSARRAWIEILTERGKIIWNLRRSPQGERG